MGLIESWLAREVFTAVSPTARKSRREAEKVAVAMGYGGMSERQRYKEAVRREAEHDVMMAKLEVEWESTILRLVSSQPGEWTKPTLLREEFHQSGNCVQAGIIDRLFNEGRIKMKGAELRLWPAE